MSRRKVKSEARPPLRQVSGYAPCRVSLAQRTPSSHVYAVSATDRTSSAARGARSSVIGADRQRRVPLWIPSVTARVRLQRFTVHAPLLRSRCCKCRECRGAADRPLGGTRLDPVPDPYTWQCARGVIQASRGSSGPARCGAISRRENANARSGNVLEHRSTIALSTHRLSAARLTRRNFQRYADALSRNVTVLNNSALSGR
jgi:hypothetical protein